MSVTNVSEMTNEAPVARRGSRRASRLRSRVEAVLLPLLSGVIVVGLWEFAVRHFHVPYYLVPAPSAVIAQIGKNWQLLLRELGSTVLAAAIGFAMAVCIAALLAAAIVS